MIHLIALLALLALLSPARAQWSGNAGQNLAIGDRTGEQVLPKIAVTSDGGCYLGWFDNSAGGYQVWLQRLDAGGTEQWSHNGIAVSTNPQSSSLVDWDLLCDSEDQCVLTFTDTRAGGDLDVYAYRIAPAGTFTWGAQGVTLSNNTDFEANPRVCETSDGDFVFVWSKSGTSTIQVQRLDRLGQPRYALPDGLAILPDASATPGFARVVAADAGAFVVAWVRNTGNTNKHIHAQKFDTAGTALWNAGTRLPVFDQTSVPIAHDPRLLPDGAGGAVFAWHFATGNVFSCRVQRVLAGGTEAYPHNGVDVCTNTNSKFDPAVCWHLAAQEAVVFWNERNTAQSTWGISAQKVTGTGQLAWGSAGVTLLPINATVKYAPVCVGFAGGGMGFVLEESLGGLNDRLLGLRVDAAGATPWATPVVACNVASDKLRLQAAVTRSGSALLAWTDKRADTGNVIAQNVNADGSLGASLGSVQPYGCNINPAGSLVTTGRPAFGSTLRILIDNPLATQAPGALGVLAIGLAANPLFPCGAQVPGFGMAGPVGEVLVDLNQPVASMFGGVWLGTGNPIPFGLAVPLQIALLGMPLHLQGALLDLQPAAPVPIGVTTAVRAVAGY